MDSTYSNVSTCSGGIRLAAKRTMGIAGILRAVDLFMTVETDAQRFQIKDKLLAISLG